MKGKGGLQSSKILHVTVRSNSSLFDHVLLILLLNLRHLFYLYLVFPPKRLLNHVDYGCSGQVTIITGVSFQLYQSINSQLRNDGNN